MARKHIRNAYDVFLHGKLPYNKAQISRRLHRNTDLSHAQIQYILQSINNRITCYEICLMIKDIAHEKPYTSKHHRFTSETNKAIAQLHTDHILWNIIGNDAQTHIILQAARKKRIL